MARMETPLCEFGKPCPDFALPGVDGKVWTRDECRGPNGLLVMFICNHCPYVQAVLDRIIRDCKELARYGIGCVAINPNDPEQYPEDSFENMKELAREKGFPFPYLLDETQEVARAFGAVCTPDFFGYNTSLALQYRGRIDESGKQPAVHARRELFEAMRRIAITGNGPREQYPSMGCSIKWKPEKPEPEASQAGAGVKKMGDLDFQGKRVLIRADLNVPIEDGRVTSDVRIRASVPTIRRVLEQGASCVMILSHLGRPQEGEYDPRYSLAPVAECLSGLLEEPVRLVKDWIDGVECESGEVLLLENVRFLEGEKADDEALGKKMAELCEIFVMDAFGTAHRAQASTHAVARFAPQVCAGLLLAQELDALTQALESPQRPLLAIVGGSKVSTKLTVLETLAQKVDQLIVGGGIANTFIAAAGMNVGKSLHEPDLIPAAKRLMEQARTGGAEIPLPVDVVVAKEFSPTAEATVRPVDQVADDEMILDIGPRTAEQYADAILNAGTIVWNGPVGVFEFEPFSEGTRRAAEAIAESHAFSIAGGGDTLAAIEKFGVGEGISYQSTGGGAFLEFLEGKKLPAVEILEQRDC